MKHAPATIGLCFALAVLGSSCGGGGTTSPTGTTAPTSSVATLVLVIQGDPAEQVSVSLDGQVLFQGLTSMNTTNPLIVPSGEHQLLAQTSSGTLGDPHDTPVPLNLTANSHTTVYFGQNCVFGASDFVYTDDTTPASGSMAKLRIANQSCALAMNIYIVPLGSQPTGDPQISNSLGTGNPTYMTFAPGNYDVYFVTAQTSGGAPPTVLYHTGSFPLAANQNRSLYFFDAGTIPNGSGGLPQQVYTSATVADLN
jgi:hypothetical protein